MIIPNMYNIKISCKDENNNASYNIDIDTDVTITATVLDFNGEPVIGKSLTIYYDDETSIYTGTTDSNGKISTTYTCTEWGIHTFSVETYNTHINVNGWKTIQTATKFTARSNGRMVSIRCSQGSNSGTVGTEYDIGTLNEPYRPQYMVIAPTTSIGDNGGHFGFVRINTDGAIKLVISRSTYNSSGGVTLYGTVEFAI